MDSKLDQQTESSIDKPINVSEHKLADEWVLWYHDNESDWTSLDSYQKVSEFSTIEEFWSLYNVIPSVADHFVFLMKKGHPPMWDASENNLNNKRCGMWLFKVSKRYADTYWLKFSMYLVGRTIADKTNDLIGISLSPRDFNCTLKIWNNDSGACKDQVNFNMAYPEFQHGKPLYKEFNGNQVS